MTLRRDDRMATILLSHFSLPTNLKAPTSEFSRYWARQMVADSIGQLVQVAVLACWTQLSELNEPLQRESGSREK
jgi:hypothetical protein